MSPFQKDQNSAELTFFDAQRLGKSFVEISNDVIQTESHQVVSKWWHSDKGGDLFVWLDEKSNIIKQQLSFHGQVIEWNLLEGVRTGIVMEEGDEEDPLPGVDASDLVNFDAEPQKSSLQLAASLVHHITVVEESLREAIKKNFLESPTVESLSPKEFLQRYGPLSAKKSHRKRSQGWKFLAWLKSLFRR